MEDAGFEPAKQTNTPASRVITMLIISPGQAEKPPWFNDTGTASGLRIDPRLRHIQPVLPPFSEYSGEVPMITMAAASKPIAACIHNSALSAPGTRVSGSRQVSGNGRVFGRQRALGV